MRIRTQFKLGALIPIILGCLIGLGWLATLSTLDQADYREQTITGIVKAVFELNILAYEYAQHPSDRPRVQWNWRTRSLHGLLQELEKEPEGSDRIVRRLRETSEYTAKLFEALAARSERLESSAEIPAAERQANERVVSQLLAHSQQMVQDAVLLAEQGERYREKVRSRMRWLMVVFIVVLSGATVAIAVRTSRQFGDSLATLHAGVEDLASGRLDRKIEIHGDTEFRDIAAAFNEMAGKLHTSRSRLEEELHQRKTAEEQLRRLNETLEERVASRTALAEQRAVQLRSLASEVTLAEQRERRNIAQFLHDSLGQTLIAAKMKCQILHRTDDPGIKKEAALLDEFLGQAVQSSRQLMVDLSPPVLYGVGLEAAISEHIERLNRTGQLKVRLLAKEETDSYPEDLRVLLFHAVRELLFNVIKHSKTDEATVEMAQEDGYLRVTVEDRGVGFDPERLQFDYSDHFGLFSIRERLELLGGRLELVAAPSDGTRASLIVPIPSD